MKSEKSPAGLERDNSDKDPTPCRGDDNAPGREGDLPAAAASLPRHARLPINRCNLPAVVLGSLTYHRHPAALMLDGIAELHRDLFRRLDAASEAERPTVFRDYMTVRFRLEWPEQVGLTGARKGRAKASYIKTLRGWSFNADSREGAVLKGWVESRFGLLPRWHGESLRDPGGEGYARYLEMRSQGLFGTNALEAQLDLVYSYCQYELARRHPGARHVTLYRGVNGEAEHEVLERGARGQRVVLLNNLSSFTCQRERACEFGDTIVTVEVPLPKILFYCGLLPGVLQGEDEFLVIGGVVSAVCSSF